MDIEQHVNNVLENMILNNDSGSQNEMTTIEYINKIFPNEQSLSNIDELLRILKDKINILDNEIRQDICSQKISEENGRKTLENARNLILNLSNVITEIKNQAKQSEKIVNEITCNIKQLDNAKRNLTLSIIMLNNLHILVQGTIILKETSKKRQYSAASKTLQGILDVLKQFDRFKHIPHIAKLTTDIDECCKTLGEQILSDFHETFDVKNVSRALSQNQIQSLAEGCLVLSILEPKYKQQLITWLVDMELAEYKALFRENQDISWLDKIDNRFSWLKKHLMTFEEKMGFLFPPSWEISECIAVKFCEITRNDLIKVMSNRFIKLDVNILLSAISKATAFEKLLSQRFIGSTIQEKNEKDKKSSFTGLITVCFENYLNIYVEAQDKNFEKLMNQFTDDLQKSTTAMEKAEIYASSGKLFTQYKNCLIQCISLSNRLPLVMLSNTFQKYLREYANRILQNTIPRIDLENKSYSIGEIIQICCIILTANYCRETTRQLEKKIQEKIDQTLIEKIDMSSECDIFQGIISNCIQLLSHSIESCCEKPLSVMVKTVWSNMGTPSGHSQYVSSLINIFHQYFPVIRENLLDVPDLFHNFCLKFSDVFIKKFVSNIYKCKPLSQGAAEQLLLDSHTLKKILLDQPEFKSKQKNTTPAVYINSVTSGMTKAEMILKIVLVPSNPADLFVDNYFKLFQAKDLGEFQKIIEMKGLKKSESVLLFDLFKKKMIAKHFEENEVIDNDDRKDSWIQKSSSLSNIEQSANTNETKMNDTTANPIDSNRIKKLEKLIKKRL
ncbi:hypothetical protein NH340_JMT03073 [Sarcoptes scabiei]|nr:hypothetical protein NH340_JMT03073 [Sarcoptes scabiei]